MFIQGILATKRGVAPPEPDFDKKIKTVDDALNTQKVQSTLVTTGDLKKGETLTQNKAAELYINPAKKYDPFRKALDAVLIDNGLFEQWQKFITQILEKRQSFGTNALAESLQFNQVVVPKGLQDISLNQKKADETVANINTELNEDKIRENGKKKTHKAKAKQNLN